MTSGYEKSPDYGGSEPTRCGIILGVLIFIAVVVALLFFGLHARAGELTGSAGKVVDGDTFWLCDKAECHKIRICGIDAPERGELGYQESGAALMGLMKGKTVRCVQVGNNTPCDNRSKPIKRDRIVAQCFVDGVDIAVPLVAQGHACDWPKFSGGAYSQGENGEACP